MKDLVLSGLSFPNNGRGKMFIFRGEENEEGITGERNQGKSGGIWGHTRGKSREKSGFPSPPQHSQICQLYFPQLMASFLGEIIQNFEGTV